MTQKEVGAEATSDFLVASPLSFLAEIWQGALETSFPFPNPSSS